MKILSLSLLAERLHERHGSAFDRILELRDGRNRVPVATRDKGQLTRWRQVGHSGIYLSAVMAARIGFRRAHGLLEFFGHPTTDIRIWAEEVRFGPADPRAGIKPAGFRIGEERHSFQTWKDLLTRVAVHLHERHGRDFDRILELRGRMRPFASRDQSELIRSAPVGESGIFIDINLSAKDIVRRAHLFLRHFGHDPSDLEVLYD